MIKGSYRPEDITFLLKPVQIAPTDVATKERLIQSGSAHYSEMISKERRPDARYLAIFEQACAVGKQRIAREISQLAVRIANRTVASTAIVAADQNVADGLMPEAPGALDSQITLCSLVRAGVPYGVLLQRELTALGVDSQHFGISIIRDKGLDANAIKYILERRPAGGVVFVDGWTGKGAIATELDRSWHDLTGCQQAELVVLADPSGFATMSGSHEDWLIPSGILGANVSGLISRSILNHNIIGKTDFHGSVPVSHLADIDVSLDFVDTISQLVAQHRATPLPAQIPQDLMALRTRAIASVRQVADTYEVANLNRIKPGIAEATRAILRRKPQKAFVRSLRDPDLSALVHLCRTDGVDIEEDADITGPYRAITLIEKLA